ncbi:hypothetical protein BV898_04540 [Hypsibius exemplaris]|uniref:Glycine N-acyltransferase-like protein n=1 Tax=Hypsibius exemplaris TaxID=2072580 RepID=A0A1W0X2I4_HYPEX|nr:hypothetical protein BV898_04540 [Hypsibius exemplaris]
MIELRDDQLPELVAWLEKGFPASLNIYFLARNKMRKNSDWPRLTFAVDEFPNISACVCRASPDSKGLPTFSNGYYAVFIHADDAGKLKHLLDQPGIIDWTQRIGFHSIQRPDNFRVLEEKCLSLGVQVMCNSVADYYVPHARFAGFNIKDVHCEYVLPEGYRLGPLGVENAQQIAEEKHYGDPAVNLAFFQHLIRSGFASAAIFNEENRPIAYIVQRPEGVMGAGFVNPNYRGKGYFKVVLYELLKEMGRRGETLGYADVTTGNKPSETAMTSIGGVFYDGYEGCWCEFIPKISE